MTNTAEPKRRLTRRELKRIDVQAHNLAFDQLKVSYRRGYPTTDALLSRKKQIAREIEWTESLIP